MTKTAPSKLGAAVLVSSLVADQDTAKFHDREALIDLASKIERDRRQRALDLAVIYDSSPAAAISCRFDLRDLRLLGQEVGRLAFGPSVGGQR